MSLEKLPKTYCPIKNTIVEAMALQRFSPYETSVLWVIFRKTYGWAKPDGTRKTQDWISLTQMQEATGIPKSHISRTIKLLILKRIVTQTGKFIGINKNVDQWQPAKRRHLNPQNLPKLVTTVTQTGKKKLPKLVTTKENKETIQNKKDPEQAPASVEKPVNFQRKCVICGNQFETEHEDKNVCSFACKQEKTRRNAKINMQGKRSEAPPIPCEVCGFNETTDLHHDKNGKEYHLCPTHHAMITRNKTTIEDLLKKENPELKAALESVQNAGLNIYALINQVKAKMHVDPGFMFPDEVLLGVCQTYTQEKDRIREPWPWFTRVLEAESRKWTATQNDQHEEALKKERKESAMSLGDILARAKEERE